MNKISVFDPNKHLSLNKVSIHNYKYLCGPHFINDNHWVAVFISLESSIFAFLDPSNPNNQLKHNLFDSWVSYYNQRSDRVVNEWSKGTYKFPLQKDTYSCAVFVCYFIEQLCNNKIIDCNFDLKSYKKKMLDTIFDSN